jgi:hypothetical protein
MSYSLYSCLEIEDGQGLRFVSSYSSSVSCKETYLMCTSCSACCTPGLEAGGDVLYEKLHPNQIGIFLKICLVRSNG